MNNCPICATSFDPLQGRYAPDGSVALRAVRRACRRTAAEGRDQERRLGVRRRLQGRVDRARVVRPRAQRSCSFSFRSLPSPSAAAPRTARSRTRCHARRFGWKRIPTVVVGAIADPASPAELWCRASAPAWSRRGSLSSECRAELEGPSSLAVKPSTITVTRWPSTSSAVVLLPRPATRNCCTQGNPRA